MEVHKILKKTETVIAPIMSLILLNSIIPIHTIIKSAELITIGERTPSQAPLSQILSSPLLIIGIIAAAIILLAIYLVTRASGEAVALPRPPRHEKRPKVIGERQIRPPTARKREVGAPAPERPPEEAPERVRRRRRRPPPKMGE